MEQLEDLANLHRTRQREVDDKDEEIEDLIQKNADLNKSL